jgi:MFS superfamily sulfate permease-like transporter
LFRLKKDVSFLNKPILKQRLEEVPENAEVLIDATRADFIDKDVIEVMNDFLRHAHLKNINVDIKRSLHKPMEQIMEMAFKNEERAPGFRKETNIKDSLTNFNPA